MPAKSIDDKPHPSTRALDRGLQLLTCLADNPQGLSAPDLANLNDLSRATVYRLLTTLESRRFVTVDAERRRYFLGPAIDPFASHDTTLTLAALATPHLEALCASVNESVGLHVRVGLKRVLVHKVEPPDQYLRYVIPVGTPRPLATGATGAVLMLGLVESEVREATNLAKEEIPLRKYRLLTSDLVQMHAEIREDGYCQTAETTVPDLASVAGPIYLSERVLAAIAVSGPLARFDEDARHKAGRLLAETAERISATLIPS